MSNYVGVNGRSPIVLAKNLKPWHEGRNNPHLGSLRSNTHSDIRHRVHSPRPTTSTSKKARRDTPRRSVKSPTRSGFHHQPETASLTLIPDMKYGASRCPCGIIYLHHSGLALRILLPLTTVCNPHNGRVPRELRLFDPLTMSFLVPNGLVYSVRLIALGRVASVCNCCRMNMYFRCVC